MRINELFAVIHRHADTIPERDELYAVNKAILSARREMELENDVSDMIRKRAWITEYMTTTEYYDASEDDTDTEEEEEHQEDPTVKFPSKDRLDEYFARITEILAVVAAENN